MFTERREGGAVVVLHAQERDLLFHGWDDKALGGEKGGGKVVERLDSECEKSSSQRDVPWRERVEISEGEGKQGVRRAPTVEAGHADIPSDQPPPGRGPSRPWPPPSSHAAQPALKRHSLASVLAPQKHQVRWWTGQVQCGPASMTQL